MGVLSMRGRCIHAPEKSNLVEGEIYFLYPHGGLAYDVSRFPHSGSHFGTYQKSRFEVITGEGPTEPSKPLEPSMLEEDKVYEAELIWRKEGYSSELGKYFIRATDGCYANKRDCYFYADPELKLPKGRYPLHWFTNIQEHGVEIIKELPREQWQQMDLFNL